MISNLASAFHQQRSFGRVELGVGVLGLKHMREEGAAKVRFPFGGNEAILINTGGGLAGGDDFGFKIEAGINTKLSVTSQAAERVYRTLGPAAQVHTRLTAQANSHLYWLPQETILFEGAALTRKLDVELSLASRFIAVEPVIFGRPEAKETVSQIHFRDSWRISVDGKLIYADDVFLDGAPPTSKATLDGATAMATLIYVGPDCENLLPHVRAVLGENCAASAWNGKLVARLVARDGFELRKSLIPALGVVAGDMHLPKVWTF
jgi:urease accessory protein